jgi:hypothetical protein
VQQWAEFTTFTGETEAIATKRALQRGLQTERLDQAFLAMHRGAPTAEAAQIAGLPQAVFIEECLDHQVALDDHDDDWRSGLERAATALGAKIPRLDGDGHGR